MNVSFSFLTQTFDGQISILTGTLIAMSVFVAYTSWVFIKFGLLPSISHSYYEHDEKFLFRTFMFGIGIPFILMAISWWLVLAGVLFCVCGLSPEFKGKELKDNKYEPDKFESFMHSLGAEGGIIASLVHVCIFYKDWHILVLMLIPTIYMMRNKINNHTLWIELIAFALLGFEFLLVGS